MIDLLNKQCPICTTGTLDEITIYDDMDNVLHCTNCGKNFERWAKEKNYIDKNDNARPEATK